VELTVTVEITAVEFRLLNSFEWAVLSLLDTFQANTPTIADATAQLCIGEPAFLAAALENLRSVGALQPKTEEPRRLDLNDHDLSETGKTILREEGWESGSEETLSESIALDWPTMRLLSANGSKRVERKQSGPSPDEVQEKLTLQKAEMWLNQNDNLHCWRVKGLYVTNVES
jgi:hypothetical protein